MAFNIKHKIKELQRIKSNLPARVGNIAKNHFLKAFRDEGFTDSTLSPWKKRTTRNRSDRRNPARRALLVDSGALRRSIRVGSAKFSRIEVGSYGIKYAGYHNRGEGRQPQRKFIGSSAVMNEEIRRKIRQEFKNMLK
jgi:phage gpG-like protein